MSKNPEYDDYLKTAREVGERMFAEPPIFTGSMSLDGCRGFVICVRAERGGILLSSAIIGTLNTMEQRTYLDEAAKVAGNATGRLRNVLHNPRAGAVSGLHHILGVGGLPSGLNELLAAIVLREMREILDTSFRAIASSKDYANVDLGRIFRSYA